MKEEESLCFRDDASTYGLSLILLNLALELNAMNNR